MGRKIIKDYVYVHLLVYYLNYKMHGATIKIFTENYCLLERDAGQSGRN